MHREFMFLLYLYKTSQQQQQQQRENEIVKGLGKLIISKSPFYNKIQISITFDFLPMLILSLSLTHSLIE
jgi:hypothetical protein